MGSPKRQRKRYETPRYPWRRDLIEADLKLIGTYGLRNKHELWRHFYELSKFRTSARRLLAKSPQERIVPEKELLTKLHKLGLIAEKATIEDVLDLSIEDLLERRLQTQAVRLGLAKSPQQARQLIAHGHISLAGRKVTAPSYMVLRGEENKLKYTPTSPLAKPEHLVRKTIELPAPTPKTGKEQSIKAR